jgi:L-fuconolactonase
MTPYSVPLTKDGPVVVCNRLTGGKRRFAAARGASVSMGTPSALFGLLAFSASGLLVAAALARKQDRPGEGGEPRGHATKRPHGPIVDTHIHLYQVTRPGGVPWPPPESKALYRDVLPAEYEALARQHGVIATGIVEASPLVADNHVLLALVKGNPFFTFLVGQLELGSSGFLADLEALARDPRAVGIRGFLWSPQLTLDGKQLAHLRELARRGMTLDLVSRGDLNPKDKVEALAAAVPDLRIIIDHLGGAKGEQPAPAWAAAMQRLATHDNVYVKLSSFFDMFNPRASENEAWSSPVELAAYKPHFDLLMKAFGEDRVLWGSNWPVCELGGGYAKEIALAEAYLAPLGERVRDKVMYQNAQAFYRRRPAQAR